MQNSILRIPRRHLLFLVATVTIVGCTSQPNINATNTTYPVDRKTTLTQVVNLPVPISIDITAGLSGGTSGAPVNERIGYSPGKPVLQGKFNTVVMGDAAEEELWILPRNISERSEKALLSRVNEGGRRACGGDFRLKNTKYFYGTEATLDFLNIPTPALQVRYRCRAAREPVSGLDFGRVSSLANRFQDHRFFDISAFNVSNDTPKVLSNLTHFALSERMRVIESRSEGNLATFVASRGGGLGRPPAHLVVVIRRTSIGSQVTLMYLTYEGTGHDRGVRGAGTFQPGFLRQPQPRARDRAYRDALQLATKL